MAETSFGVNDTLAVKLWSKNLAVAERLNLDIAPLMGDDDNSVIQIKSETKKGAGDKVTFALRARLTGDGKTEGETAEGNGEALSLYADSLYINELGHIAATRSENTIDSQRVPFDLRAQCKDALAQWWSDRLSVSFFNQVCGYTAETRTKYLGLNSVTAPTSTRRIVAGTGTADQDLTSSDVFTLDLIDQAVEMAKIGSNMVRPIKVGGQPKYIMYLHPYQVTSLRTNSATGQWLDIQKAALAGGVDKSPIYTGALGEYNGVVLRTSQDVTSGVNGSTGAVITTVKRGVLLGAQSAMFGYGEMSSGGRYRWNEELLDHKRKLEVSAWQIWGMKKTVFNSVDFGTVVVSSYAAAAS